MNNRINLLAFFALFFVSAPVLAQFSTGYELNAQTMQANDIDLGDLDNDGLPDIIVAHAQDNKISWFRNLGGNQFELLQDLVPNLPTPFSLAVSDIDGDGDKDIFASGAGNNQIVWYENDSTGTFGTANLIGTATWAHLTATDLNGDGLPDLLVGSQTGSEIKWYENLGNGLFSAEQQITTLVVSVKDVIAVDLDGDLDLDIISASSADNKMAWYENLGGGTFGPQQVISLTASGANSVCAADLDNDGDQDLVLSGGGDNSVAWYENLGGSFSAENIITTNASFVESVSCADMDGDGDFDVLTNQTAGSYTRLVWFENVGGAVFSGYTNITDDSYANVVRCADMDNDGDTDVVSLYTGAYQVSYHDNPGDGTFGQDHRLTIWGNPSRGRPIDVDLDGDVDVLITMDGTYWCENLGGGKYGAVKHYITGSMQGADMGDLDNDGDLDIVLANGTGATGYANVVWMENLGNGLFGPEVDITTDVTSSRRVEIVDLNQDGWLDVVAGGGTMVAWYRNLGGGSFSSTQTLGTVTWCHSVETFDLNNDGELDVLYVSRNENTLYWNENLGNGTFGPQTVIGSNQMGARGTYAADIDNDGDLDVFVASRDDNKVAWFENLGGGSFGTENIVTTSLQDAVDVFLADFDLDGDMDLSVASINEDIYWYENLGGGTFGTGQIISNQPFGMDGLEGADFDGDGDIDLLSINFSFNSIRWFENYNISSMQIKGRIFVDENVNGMYDSLEASIPQLGVLSTPSVGYTYTYPDGRYFMLFNGALGTYNIAPQPLDYWGVTTGATSYTINVTPGFTSLNNLDFGLYPDTLAHDIELALVGAFPRCNDTVNYWIDLENVGTTFPSGLIHLELDDSLDYVSANITPDSITGQDIYWSYDSLDYFETMQIELLVGMPDFNSMGDSIQSILSVATDSLGTIVYTNADTLNQLVMCAYDPNDKTAVPSGDSLGYIWPAPEKIEYTIRFQNTGSDTARTVIISDQLDDNLVWNTLHPIASSHPMTVEMTQGGEVHFVFDDIMLPDSNVNEPASHGFVRYAINVLPGLPIQSQISNTANIYFDLNPAVVTNTVVHVLDTLEADPPPVAGISESLEDESVRIYPNPFKDYLDVHYSNTKGENYSILVLDIHGRELIRTECGTGQLTRLGMENLERAVYFIRAMNEDNQLLFVRKVIRQ